MSGTDKRHALRGNNMRRQMRDLWRHGEGEEQMKRLETRAVELARERRRRRFERFGDGKGEEVEDVDEEGEVTDDDEDEDEDEMVVEWEDQYPTNNSDHRDDDDNSGGPSAGPVAQVTALTWETTIPIR